MHSKNTKEAAFSTEKRERIEAKIFMQRNRLGDGIGTLAQEQDDLPRLLAG